MTVVLKIDLSESLSAEELRAFEAKCREASAPPEAVMARLIREWNLQEEAAA